MSKPGARLLTTVFLGALVGLADAQEPGRAPGDPELRRFLVSQRAWADDWLERRSAEVPTLDAARSPALAAGFHVLDLAGWSPPLRYVAIVPKTPAPKAGRPVLVGRNPILGLPPDELGLRQFYGGFLEEGFTLLVPIRPKYMGVGIEKSSPERDALGMAHDLLACLLADLELTSPIDRERVLYLGPWIHQPIITWPQTWPNIDVTPFAGLYAMLPGGAWQGRPPDVRRWQGRTILFHRSRHNPDRQTLLEQRLTHLEPPVRIVRHVDRRLDYFGEVVITREAVRRLTRGVRRPAAADVIEFLAGGARPSAHEWLDAPGLGEDVRIRAERSGPVIEITTPDAKSRAPFNLDVWLSKDPGNLTVRFNGRPVHGGPVRNDATNRLRALRHALQTGRPTFAVLRIRP